MVVEIHLPDAARKLRERSPVLPASSVSAGGDHNRGDGRVVYRKGGMTKAAVDGGWPHQVALPSSQVVAEFNDIMAFCTELSMCVRGHWFRRDGADWVVKCFATKEDADKFAARFGGEYMTPETRPSWIEKRKKLR